VLVLTFVKNAI